MEKTKQFLREHKVLVAASVAVILIAIIIAVMVIMSRPEAPVSNTEGDVIESGITEVTESLSSAEEDENYLQDINKAPENTEDSNTEGDVDKDNVDEFTDTESDTDVSTENPDEDTKVDNSESITKPDEEDTSSETKEPEETTSSESSTTVVPPVVEEPVTPPVKEEPVTPPHVVTPSVSWTGSGVTLGSLGVTIPTLRDFNDEALTDNTNNTFWTGDSSDTPTVQTMYDTLNGVRNAVINTGAIGENAQGFAVEQYSISWDWASYSSTHDFQLYRNPLDGTYTLTINDHLLPETVNHLGVQIGNYNRDIVLSLCSIVSSQPQTVYNQLYEDIYGEICISDTGWTTVGDCKMHFDYDSSYDGHFVYKIKAK